MSLVRFMLSPPQLFKQWSLFFRVNDSYIVVVQHSGPTHYDTQRCCWHGYLHWWFGTVHGRYVGVPERKHVWCNWSVVIYSSNLPSTLVAFFFLDRTFESGLTRSYAQRSHPTALFGCPMPRSSSLVAVLLPLMPAIQRSWTARLVST